MDKNYCKCCEYFAITRGSNSLEEQIECRKHNTVCAVTNENLHSTCDDFKADASHPMLERLTLMRKAISECKWRQNVCGTYICAGNVSPCQIEIERGRCDTLNRISKEFKDRSED